MQDASMEYGKLTSAQDASLVSAEDLELHMPLDGQGKTGSAPDEGNALWLYQTQGRIFGVPVEERARGLKIDSDELLEAAFQMERRPRSLMLALAPGASAQLAEYEQLLERVYDGTAYIVSEDKQFDQANSCFIVWVRYDELRYTLHPRFSYLLEE